MKTVEKTIYYIVPYRIEMLKCRKTGEPSKWKYFSHMKEILKESKLVNLRLCMDDNFGMIITLFLTY